jgi:hypothetical protein
LKIKFHLFKLLIAHCIVWSGLATADESQVIYPKIESISGSKTISLILNQMRIEAGVGTELPEGSRLSTNSTTSASLLYPDGSRVTLYQNTDFVVENHIEGTQWNRLKTGKVRGIIQKVTLPPSSKPRFLIRSKSAVLGVRGTEFVMALGVGQNSAQINTLEGVVDVARNEVALLSGHSTSLPEGKFIESSIGGLSEPRSFNKSEFLQNLENSSQGEGLEKGANSPISTQEDESKEVPSLKSNAEPSIQNFPAPTRFPDSERTKTLANQSNEKNKNETNGESSKKTGSSRFALLSFQAGIFFAKLLDSSIIRAVHVAWTPIVPVPFIPFLTVRGQIGVSFAQQGSLNQNFLIKEFQVFLTASFFNFIFAEAGIGEQIWQNPRSYDAGLKTVNAGLLFKRNWISRVYLGYQVLNIQPKFDQYQAGVGISF